MKSEIGTIDDRQHSTVLPPFHPSAPNTAIRVFQVEVVSEVNPRVGLLVETEDLHGR
jgi:hypothetical protein